MNSARLRGRATRMYHTTRSQADVTVYRLLSDFDTSATRLS